MSLKLEERRIVKFYLHRSYKEYISECLSKGFIYISDPEQHKWVDILRNKAQAAMYPEFENIYSSISFLSITYKGETKILKFDIFLLYNEPSVTPTDTSENFSGDGADYRGF